MDRNHLTRRIRMLGIPILIPAAAFVLVAYGLAEPNPRPGMTQEVQHVHIHIIQTLKTCVVAPFHVVVERGGEVSFHKHGKDAAVLFFPKGLLVEEGAVASLNPQILPIKAGETITRTVTQSTGYYPYDVFVEACGFIEGQSHPGIIVE